MTRSAFTVFNLLDVHIFTLRSTSWLRRQFQIQKARRPSRLRFKSRCYPAAPAAARSGRAKEARRSATRTGGKADIRPKQTKTAPNTIKA
jgi:hypothetical protein